MRGGEGGRGEGGKRGREKSLFLKADENEEQFVEKKYDKLVGKLKKRKKKQKDEK